MGRNPMSFEYGIEDWRDLPERPPPRESAKHFPPPHAGQQEKNPVPDAIRTVRSGLGRLAPIDSIDV